MRQIYIWDLVRIGAVGRARPNSNFELQTLNSNLEFESLESGTGAWSLGLEFGVWEFGVRLWSCALSPNPNSQLQTRTLSSNLELKSLESRAGVWSLGLEFRVGAWSAHLNPPEMQWPLISCFKQSRSLRHTLKPTSFFQMPKSRKPWVVQLEL